jgi:hypothetical protein
MDNKQAEVKVYGTGVDEKGGSVVWALVNGSKFTIPTNAVTMARLAAAGVKVINGAQ